jgi:hypothetical protein
VLLVSDGQCCFLRAQAGQGFLDWTGTLNLIGRCPQGHFEEPIFRVSTLAVWLTEPPLNNSNRQLQKILPLISSFGAHVKSLCNHPHY